MNGSPSVKVALFIRNGGSESPCRWFYITGIYKWDPELVDVYIEDEGREWELVEFSFFSKYANPLYPKETCSPLGMIVGKFHE